jgi:hypothetical protein
MMMSFGQMRMRRQGDSEAGSPATACLLLVFLCRQRTFASNPATGKPYKVRAIVVTLIVEPVVKGEYMSIRSKLSKIATIGLMVSGLLTAAGPVSAFSKYETIEAQAFGTGTQMGQNIGVTLNIYEFSTPADRAVLVQAFEKGQNQGLVNALQKMRAVGHVEITGTLGFDCAYIKMTQTPTGRKIVFVTNRQITFAEAYADSQSQSFNLTAGEFDLNDQDKSKSTGMVYPLAQLILDKQGQLQLELNQNPWRLSDVLDWKGTANN